MPTTSSQEVADALYEALSVIEFDVPTDFRAVDIPELGALSDRGAICQIYPYGEEEVVAGRTDVEETLTIAVLFSHKLLNRESRTVLMRAVRDIREQIRFLNLAGAVWIGTSVEALYDNDLYRERNCFASLLYVRYRLYA